MPAPTYHPHTIPSIAMEAYTLETIVYGVHVLKERRNLHLSGKIRKGKRGDILISDGAGTTMILPGEALALFTRSAGDDAAVANFGDALHIS